MILASHCLKVAGISRWIDIRERHVNNNSRDAIFLLNRSDYRTLKQHGNIQVSP